MRFAPTTVEELDSIVCNTDVTEDDEAPAESGYEEINSSKSFIRYKGIALDGLLI